MIIDRIYSTKHEHLVEYLDKSLKNNTPPMIPGEKADTYHYGIKRSIRIYYQGGVHFMVTSTGNDVHLYAVMPDDIRLTRIFDGYDPYSVTNVYSYKKEG